MYFPDFDTSMTEISLSWPYKMITVRTYYPNTYSQELLGSGDYMSDHEGGSERIDDMFVVWMEN
jgi:hypothetical protein|tara:strand:+ start:1033 stop:1224 length:192 start_codon:yes stop_codon:yes gene_type:complete